MNQAQIFKILLIGDVSTGKTSFLTQLIYQAAEKMPKPTSQLSFFTLRISNPQTVIQVWDSPGDQKYHYKILSILEGFDAVIIFIDVTNQHTLLKAKIMIEQLKIYSNLSIHLIQSKVDVVLKAPYKRKVFTQELKGLAQKVVGGAFQYLQNQSVQDILHQIVTWKNTTKPKKIFNNKQKPNKNKNFQGQREFSEKQKQKQADNQFCDCQIF